MKTYYWSKKLTANNSQQTYEFPKRLRGVSILNFGNNDIYVEFENDIHADSIVIPVKGSIHIPTSMLDMRYKTNSGESTLYVYGLRHEKYD